MSHSVTRSQNIVRKESIRLSSGKRITSFSEDSAGKAVETTLNARTRSRRVAKRNSEHARSMPERRKVA